MICIPDLLFTFLLIAIFLLGLELGLFIGKK